MTGLDEPYRTTVVMRYFESKTSVEIGQALGVPEGTVRWRLKHALELLRRELDQRSGGDRSVWCRSLLPLLGTGDAATKSAANPTHAPVARGRTTSALITSAVGVGSLCVGLALWRGCPRESGPATAMPGEQERSASNPTESTRPVQAALPDDRADAVCSERLRALAGEVAHIETELRRVQSSDVLFKEGVPDDAARATFAPILEAMLARVEAPPTSSLECRTYACRLVLTEPEGGPSRDRWMQPLQRHAPFISAVGSGTLFSGEGGKRRDPISGAWLDESVVYWKLRERGATHPLGTLPASLSRSDCRARVAELEARLRLSSEAVEGHRPLPERHSRGAPDPGAQEEVGRLVAQALTDLGKTTVNGRVTCRGGVCKIELESAGPRADLQDALRQVVGSHDLRVRLGGSGTVGWSYTYKELRDRSSGESMAALLRLHREFKASGAVEACRRRHGGDGPLDGAIWIGERDVPEPLETERLPNGLAFAFGAKVPFTPDGHCVIEAFRKAAREVRVPVHQAAAYLPFWLLRPGG